MRFARQAAALFFFAAAVLQPDASEFVSFFNVTSYGLKKPSNHYIMEMTD